MPGLTVGMLPRKPVCAVPCRSAVPALHNFSLLIVPGDVTAHLQMEKELRSGRSAPGQAEQEGAWLLEGQPARASGHRCPLWAGVLQVGLLSICVPVLPARS